MLVRLCVHVVFKVLGLLRVGMLLPEVNSLDLHLGLRSLGLFGGLLLVLCGICRFGCHDSCTLSPVLQYG